MPIPPSLQQGLRLPLVAAPMFLTSGPALVTACCKAGVIGTFPALSQRTTEGLRTWLREIADELGEHEAKSGQKPAAFGVNLIVHKSNPRVFSDLEACAEALVAPAAVDLSHLTEPYKKEADHHAKTWRDVWSAGQGVGAIDDLPDTATLVERLRREYRAAVQEFQRSSARFLA